MFPQNRLFKLYAKIRRFHGGFTLLEIMVVTAVIAIILSIAGLSLRGGGLEDVLEQEAERLHRLMVFSAENALIHNRATGISFFPGGYRFYIFDGDAWVEQAQDDILHLRRLPEEISLEIQIEGRKIKLGDTGLKKTPQLIFFSSGELTPFRCVLSLQSRREPAYEITGALPDKLIFTRKGET